MNYKTLKILIFAAALSLIGILLTQGFWLKKNLATAEKQFDHRADQMLSNVVDELQNYADTAAHLQIGTSLKNKCIFDVVDTVLLGELIEKYSRYHKLDTSYAYGLIVTSSERVIYSVRNFIQKQEGHAYKVCLSCLWQEEYIHLSVFFPNKDKYMLRKQVVWIIFSTLFVLIVFGALVLIVLSIFKQKKISEIKNDFVNNMTHELKTPLSTISVASEVLMKGAEKSGDKRQSKYSKVIFDENQRMRKLVDKVLNIATLDRGYLAIEKEEIDIHKTVYDIVETFCFEACSKKVNIDYKLEATNPVLMADKLHLRNILNNLVDNAVKYSDSVPQLSILTDNSNGFLKINVADKGKGIPKESLQKVFEKFYRVPSGNVHNVKGFGLGLYYVKTMVESHGGKIEIDSVLNKGTSVSVYLPQQNITV